MASISWGVIAFVISHGALAAETGEGNQRLRAASAREDMHGGGGINVFPKQQETPCLLHTVG